MKEFTRVRNWAHDRNLIEGSTPKKQSVKLVEELGEIAAGIARGNAHMIMDGIGDVAVVATIIAAQVGVNVEEPPIPDWTVPHEEMFSNLVSSVASVVACCDTAIDNIDIVEGCQDVIYFLRALAAQHDLAFDDCLDHAWEQIKDRKGRMVNGVFVKDI